MVKKKRTSLFSAAAHAAQTSEAADPQPAQNLVDERLDYLSDLKSRKRLPATQFEVEPDDCVIWDKHNRIYDRLDVENCADLIAAFKAVGRQQQPALVRRVPGKKRQTFEVIAGVRRLWVVRHLRKNGFPDLKYLVEVRDELADDISAFRAMEAENRGRNDLSPYEQGLSYKRMLQEAFAGNQTALAEAVGRNKSTVSRYIQLAEIPPVIVDCFAELSDLTYKQGPKLLQALTKSKSGRDRMLDEAAELSELQRSAKQKGEPLLSGPVVMKRLLSSVEKRGGARGPLAQFGPKDSPHLLVTSRSREGFNVFVPENRGATPQQILDHFKKALADFYGQKKS